MTIHWIKKFKRAKRRVVALQKNDKQEFCRYIVYNACIKMLFGFTRTSLVGGDEKVLQLTQTLQNCNSCVLLTTVCMSFRLCFPVSISENSEIRAS